MVICVSNTNSARAYTTHRKELGLAMRTCVPGCGHARGKPVFLALSQKQSGRLFALALKRESYHFLVCLPGHV